MSAPTLDSAVASEFHDPALAIRARAIADALRFRRIARSARTDGMPKAELRAAHARAAALTALSHARRLSVLCAMSEMTRAQARAAERHASTIDL